MGSLCRFAHGSDRGVQAWAVASGGEDSDGSRHAPMLSASRDRSLNALLPSLAMSLESLANRFWNDACATDPVLATVLGYHDFDDQLHAFDENWLAETTSAFRGILEETVALDVSHMTTQERITRGALIHQIELVLRRVEIPFLTVSIDPFLGPHIRLLNYTRQNTVSDTSQADALLSRYEKVPSHLEGALRISRENVARGQAPAEAAAERVLSQLDGYLASDLADDPFLALKVPGDPAVWREKAERLVTDVVRPAFQAFRDGLVEHVAPAARPDDKCGLVWMEDGEEIYAGLIDQYTQVTASAEEIHQIGQRWATEINAAEWAEIGHSAFGLSTLEDIFERLHADPALRFESENEMLAHAREALDRAWAVVDDWFGERPDTPCQVVPVPAATAPAMPPAYYMAPAIDGSRPGTYFLNTYQPDQRDRFEYESIHFHEGIPGHHFDRSLAAELDGIPTFRRHALLYAHTEGWGLYSERLADEMGLYSSDVDRLGMVSADAWRAGRLVTDTGIHALGWSRQQAIDFLQEWTPIGGLTIEQEVDRYIGMPGQALAYKMGQLEILRLREEAEGRLGEAFDIKGFHDTMLVNGAMPLPMLATAVEDWVESVS